jgi:HTH-type transcriptional regulator/antitoxin HigA
MILLKRGEIGNSGIIAQLTPDPSLFKGDCAYLFNDFTEERGDWEIRNWFPIWKHYINFNKSFLEIIFINIKGEMAAWKQLKTKKDYKAALDRVNALIDARRSDAQQNESLLLSYLIEEYEEQHIPMSDAAPHEVIQFMMEMKGLKQKDLVPILGTKGYVSKILNGAASIPLESIDTLSHLLGIPVDALIPKSKWKKDEINMVAERGGEV